jgi:beta-glucosidase
VTQRTFPSGFDWSTATAAHQIEGGNAGNDWWRWELADGSPCVESSGDACDSWNRWAEDLDLVASLGCTSYRFSLEWSRIQPTPGEWSDESMDHYVAICERLVELGLHPTITFHHFTNPMWIADQGGWTAADTPKRFADFAFRASQRLDGLMHRACTLNEPNVVSFMGYRMGMFPPGECDHDRFLRVEQQFVDGHRSAVEAIRAATTECEVGLTVSMADYHAAEAGEPAVAESERSEDVLLDATGGDDFVGIQTYTRMVMGPNGFLGPQPGVPVVESMGYEYWPEALGATVRRAWERTQGRVPILVTENGIATDDDDRRIDYIRRALTSLHECIEAGIDVRGYAYWSLLDNFEWTLGYRPRFGLVSVDRSTFRRTAKPSAAWYAQVIAQNAII